MSESVYVLKNPSYPADLLKIGRTTRTTKQRMNELSKQTGVPTPFVTIMKIKTGNSSELEKLIHTHLHNVRLPNKEFFQISEEKLYSILTDELQLPVEKNTDTDDDVDDVDDVDDDVDVGDSESGGQNDDSDEDIANYDFSLESKYNKMYTSLTQITINIDNDLKNMASKYSDKYDIVKHSPKGEYYKDKKYFVNGVMMCGDDFSDYCNDVAHNGAHNGDGDGDGAHNGAHNGDGDGDSDGDGDGHDKIFHSVANKLYDYDFSGYTTWYDRFIANKIQEIQTLERGILNGDDNLKKKNKELKHLNKNKTIIVNEIKKLQDNGMNVDEYEEKMKFVDREIKDVKERKCEFKQDDAFIKQKIKIMLNDVTDLKKRFQEKYQAIRNL